MIKKTKYLVIGGGISGSSTALFLSKETNDFILVESQDRLGGVIKTDIIDGYTCENGPNTILMNNDEIKSLIKDLSLDSQIVFANKNIDNKYFLHKNKILKFPNSLFSFLTTRLISFSDKIKVMLNFLYFKRSYPIVYDYFKNNFSKAFHDNIIEPFLNGIFAGDTRKMSLEHTMPKFHVIQKKYKSFFQYLLFNKQNTKSLPFSIKGGFEKIFDKIHLKLNKNILLNHKVNNIKYENNEYIVSFKNKNIIIAKHIFISIGLSQVFKLLNYQPKKSFVGLYNPIDVFHFGISEVNIGKKINGFGLLSKKSEKKNILGILFNSDIFPHTAPSEYKLYTVLVGGEKQNEICRLPIEKVLQLVEQELKELFDIKEIAFKKYFRWKRAIPKYNYKLLKNIDNEIIMLSKKYKNIYFQGNYTKGVSVSACVTNSYHLVERITKKIS